MNFLKIWKELWSILRNQLMIDGKFMKKRKGKLRRSRSIRRNKKKPGRRKENKLKLKKIIMMIWISRLQTKKNLILKVNHNTKNHNYKFLIWVHNQTMKKKVRKMKKKEKQLNYKSSTIIKKCSPCLQNSSGTSFTIYCS